MALRVFSYYPTNIVIDGELIPIHVKRLNPDEALRFNQCFAKTGKKITEGAVENPEDEREAKQFVVQAISDYITVLPGHIFCDDATESVTAGAELCRLFGARDEVLTELLLHVFMENKLNAEQKNSWKTKLAPFVPTPVKVADRMAELANVGPADTFYDLGCGDGALCIAAAKRGAHAFGFDIDDARVTAATAAATAAGVAALCTFAHKDALLVDVSPATVVGMYLLAGANEKLRPIFAEKLPRGARVVSHAFTLGSGWTPDASEFVALDEGETAAHHGARWIYLYSVDRFRP